MTFYRDINTKYFTKQIANLSKLEDLETVRIVDGTYTSTVDPRKQYQSALIEQRFKSPLLESGKEWLCAVERFEVSLNGIPFYDNEQEVGFVGTPNLYGPVAGKIHVVNVVAGVVAAPIPLLRKAYSLPDLILAINEAIDAAYENGHLPPHLPLPTGIAGTTGLEFALLPDGKVSYTVNEAGAIGFPQNWAETRYLHIPPLMLGILGILISDLKGAGTNAGQIPPIDPPIPAPGISAVWRSIAVSREPRWDCGSFADHIRIYSNIGTNSDNVNNAQANIITDLSIASSEQFNSSLTFNTDPITDFKHSLDGSSFAPRQKAVYAPARLRWVNIDDPSPMIDITINARYVLTDGVTEKDILLPVGCVFGMKIAFYSRS